MKTETREIALRRIPWNRGGVDGRTREARIMEGVAAERAALTAEPAWLHSHRFEFSLERRGSMSRRLISEYRDRSG